MDNDDLLDELHQAKWQRQRHARHMALPPGHPDEPEDDSEALAAPTVQEEDLYDLAVKADNGGQP